LGALGLERTQARSQRWIASAAPPLMPMTQVDSRLDTIGTTTLVNLSMVTIEQGKVTKRLAAWTAIFAVATAFAGI
jgi:hypothetical protein